jgi:hypothetical protein
VCSNLHCLASIAEVEVSGKRKRKKPAAGGGLKRKLRASSSAAERSRAPRSFQRLLEDVSALTDGCMHILQREQMDAYDAQSLRQDERDLTCNE